MEIDRACFEKPQNTQMHSVGKMLNVLMLKVVVHKVTTVF
jgi:hypothetical protein